MARKKKTPGLNANAEREYTINSSVSARNLTKSELGAVIFACKNFTISECKKNNLFGLPSGHFSYVRNVTPGLVLFLFNCSDRKLHGIYEAISPGQLSINPHAWTGNSKESTAYPAQVRVRVRNQCSPLSEEQFGPVIADNYHDSSNRNLFWFELDRTQTRKLLELFLRSALPGNSALNKLPIHGEGAKSPIVERVANIAHGADKEQETWDQSPANLNQEGECSYVFALCGTSNALPQKPWSSLFKSSAASESISRDEDPQPQTSAFVPSSYITNVKWEDSRVPSSRHSQDYGYGGYADQWDTEITVMPVRRESEVFKSVASELDVDHSGDSNTDWELSYDPQFSPLEAFRDKHARDINIDLGSSLKDSGDQPFDLESMVYQLMQAVEDLKASQLKQNLRISSLEHQIQSMAEAQSLKKHFEMFTSSPTSSSSEEVYYDAHEFLSQPDGQ
ncbi:OLC1v1001408C1 [Oldenlandia corymbosa var. corymbosa]|uniref:OLC1v1001408C1 n=1 Tax=Oldenlandia corymbosa var. corymbosa TaxID=529605 RepID=A0AAV1D7R3_OLDCO|nr:OLC1v1001408C1 [Oldenlandia corymbosa var. corymbosa]